MWVIVVAFQRYYVGRLVSCNFSFRSDILVNKLLLNGQSVSPHFFKAKITPENSQDVDSAVKELHVSENNNDLVRDGV
jgi:hypothetical protein